MKKCGPFKTFSVSNKGSPGYDQERDCCGADKRVDPANEFKFNDASSDNQR